MRIPNEHMHRAQNPYIHKSEKSQETPGPLPYISIFETATRRRSLQLWEMITMKPPSRRPGHRWETASAVRYLRKHLPIKERYQPITANGCGFTMAAVDFFLGYYVSIPVRFLTSVVTIS
jgi:hypothetical protein